VAHLPHIALVCNFHIVEPVYALMLRTTRRRT
jgi:hypothetical protein